MVMMMATMLSADKGRGISGALKSIILLCITKRKHIVVDSVSSSNPQLVVCAVYCHVEDGRITLRWILEMQNKGGWAGQIFVSGYGPVASSCEHGNQPSSSIKSSEFLGQLKNYWLLKKKSAPCRWLLPPRNWTSVPFQNKATEEGRFSSNSTKTEKLVYWKETDRLEIIG